MRHLVLLPGLDGTGQLFDRFRSSAPAEVRHEVVPLPPDLLSYRHLISFLVRSLDIGPESILLAESFSGPLALGVAAQRPVAGVVLCNSFIEPPAPPLLRSVLHPALFRLAPPPWVIRRYLVGRSAPDDLVLLVRNLIGSLAPELIAARLGAILSVDAADDLRRSRCPILYLRGSQDLLVPESSSEAVLTVAGPRAQVSRIPGPHLLLQTAPEKAWEALQRFWGATSEKP